MNNSQKHSQWVINLHALLELSQKEKYVTFDEIMQIFSGRGMYFLIALLLLPFCVPIPLPGLSTPFGLLVSLLSLRLLFRRHVFYPAWLVKKKVSSKTVKKIARQLEKIFLFLERFSHTRIPLLVHSPGMRVFHHLFFFVGGLILALPLPIPFTNALISWPLFCVGFGILQEDGLLVSIGYTLFVCSCILASFLIG